MSDIEFDAGGQPQANWSKLAASPNHDKGDHVMAKVNVLMLKPSVKRVWPKRNFPHTNSPTRNKS
jgi:hypothetical protein